MKKSFTILELIFVIVILGILAGVALPRLFTGVDDAAKARLKTEVSTIRSAITSKYTKEILSGNNECPDLEKDTTDDKLFEAVLNKPLPRAPKKDNVLLWDGNGSDYNVTYNGKTIYFYYDRNEDKGCLFECNSSKSTAADFNCSILQ